jgi:hypothetical protein
MSQLSGGDANVARAPAKKVSRENKFIAAAAARQPEQRAAQA